MDAVLELIKDKDENIRRAAIEILNTCRDKRAVDQLIEATKDPDWWVSERAADALAEIGDAKALPALLEMVARNNRSLPVALAAVGKLGTFKVLDKVLPFLQRPEKEVRIAAIGAVAQLAGEQQGEAVRPYIQQAAAGAEETVLRAVTKALQKLDGRISPSGRFTRHGEPRVDVRPPRRRRLRCRRPRARNPRAAERCPRRRRPRRRRPRRRRPRARCSSKAPKPKQPRSAAARSCRRSISTRSTRAT